MKKVTRIVVVISASAAALVVLSATAVQHYYCKYCGHKTTSVNSLTASLCQRHPNGPGKGRHALYEGGEKATYVQILRAQINFHCLAHLVQVPASPERRGKGPPRTGAVKDADVLQSGGIYRKI